MSLVEHLTELRTRLLWSVLAFLIAFFACYGLAQHIYDFLVQPLADIMHEVGGSQRMIYTALTEAFFTYVKVAAFGAAIITFPIIATQIWLFIAPGLYKHEKKALLPFLLASPVLFLMGASLVYYMVMPLAWRFLLGFQTTGAETVLPIELEAKVGEYLGLVMKLILAFGLCFQMPVALTLMARVGMLTSKTLSAARKYAIVGVFVLAAVVTPPDIISQVGLAVPLILLYEGSIWSCRLVEKRRAERNGEDDDLDDLDDDDDGPDDDGPTGGPKGGPKGGADGGSSRRNPAPEATGAAGSAAPASAPTSASPARSDTRSGPGPEAEADQGDEGDEDDGPPDTDFNTGR
ncbi:twin-arginine translocase subunit TatC [Roseospira marina]|uniref:Sec-independent protein translocase protein TatC n=2 Tax=Roseospira marina TaxID=140057 RepID=A0A5M6IFS2_9PROT|nr:twin-arginine translocase subunit TatC [Roseospira marina]